jgi:GNAT superfamily N-acetyltransferase
MREGDVAGVQDVFAACEPTWPTRSPLWWWAHPTVVMEADGRIVGYASFSISLPPTPELASARRAEIGWGHGMAVHPDYHGQGIGRQLAAYRSDVMRALGLRFFIGHAQPGNQAMAAIFRAQGLEATVTIPNGLPDGAPVTLYMGDLP